MDKPRILIVDDDPGLRKTLADILALKGFEPLAAGSGAEGLSLFGENPADIALIDLNLPDITGVELLTSLKAGHPATEGIILTGNATLESAIEATNRGAFSYLQKPYDINHLLLHIQRAIEKQQAENRIRRQNSELQKINQDLKILHEVSLVINRTIDLDDLLSDVLDALSTMKLFEFEIKGAIFLAEEESLRLAAFIAIPPASLEPCKNARRGECLCGIALATGETIITEQTRPGECLVRCDNDILPHGRIIVPMKTANKTVGVLTLFGRNNAEVDSQMLMLLSSIGNQLGIAINNARLYEETKAFSLQDPLTGLANRRFMEAQLKKDLESSRRYAESLSLIMLDIDHFKKYNDTHGHLAGDQLLVKLASILSREMRSADHAFRYGGEEFLVILPRADKKSASEAAERLRTAVESETGVTISLGVVSCHKGEPDKETLLGLADDALYLAKQNGRNRVVLADSDLGIPPCRAGRPEPVPHEITGKTGLT